MKTTYWMMIIAVVAVAVLTTSLVGAEKKPAIEIRKVAPVDASVVEEWERVTTERDLLGVSASRLKRADWNWQVFVSVAEFVRKDPLAARLEEAVTSALQKTKGVKAVVREDTEVWLIRGDAGGEELVRACSIALDQLAPELRKYLKAL